MIIKIYFITLIIIPFRLLKKEKVLFIVNELERLYPKTPIPLDHKDPYTLLIAVLLSAQSTDVGVNKITPILFEKADNPYDMVKLTVNQIRSIIKPVGLSPMKSKGIYGLSKILIEKFNGKVPNDIKDLESLQGKLQFASIGIPLGKPLLGPVDQKLAQAKARPDVTHIKVKDELDDYSRNWRAILKLMRSRPSHVNELIMQEENAYRGLVDASKWGCGGVWFSGTKNLAPFV